MKTDLKKCLPEISGKKAILIEYTGSTLGRSMKIKEIEAVIGYYGRSVPLDHEVLPNICRFVMDNTAEVNIYFSNIDDLLTFDFKKAFKQLEQQKINTHWYPEKFSFRLNGDSVSWQKEDLWIDTYLSGIDLNYGLSLIKQTASIDFGLGMSLIIERKDSRNNRYLQRKIKLGYSYTSYYDQKLQLNGFISTGYSLNVPRTKRWIGIEAGYLAHRNSNLFEKNTFVFGLSLAGGQFDFTPRVYISGGPVFLGFSLNLIGW